MDAEDPVTPSSAQLNATDHSSELVGGRPLKRLQHGEIWTPEVTQRVATVVALMILTLVGNVAIIVRLAACRRRCCCCRRRPRAPRNPANPPSRVNVFIVNLALGDLTVCCFTMTTEVLFVVFEKAWLLGAAACRLLLYIQVAVTVNKQRIAPRDPRRYGSSTVAYRFTANQAIST